MAFLATLEAARNGSPQALGELLESCGGYIRVIAQERVPHKLKTRVPHSSLVQETYLRTCKHFDQFRGQTERELLAWLKKILINCLLNVLRQPQFQTPMERLPSSLAAVTGLPEQQTADKECARLVQQALRRLPARYARIIRLHHFGGLTFAELGHLLECSSEAARKLWSRAQARLGEELQASQ